MERISLRVRVKNKNSLGIFSGWCSSPLSLSPFPSSHYFLFFPPPSFLPSTTLLFSYPLSHPNTASFATPIQPPQHSQGERKKKRSRLKGRPEIKKFSLSLNHLTFHSSSSSSSPPLTTSLFPSPLSHLPSPISH